jgi:hypothetical protein
VRTPAWVISGSSASCASSASRFRRTLVRNVLKQAGVAPAVHLLLQHLGIVTGAYYLALERKLDKAQNWRSSLQALQEAVDARGEASLAVRRVGRSGRSRYGCADG